MTVDVFNAVDFNMGVAVTCVVDMVLFLVGVMLVCMRMWVLVMMWDSDVSSGACYSCVARERYNDCHAQNKNLFSTLYRHCKQMIHWGVKYPSRTRQIFSNTYQNKQQQQQQHLFQCNKTMPFVFRTNAVEFFARRFNS